MQRIIIFGLIMGIMLTSQNGFSQLNSQSIVLDGEVDYLYMTPAIDGKLDNNLQHLEPRQFTVRDKTDPSNPDISATYRLAYGSQFFYLYIEANADQLVFRDRAYQNGDGFHMVLAKPKPDQQPTDEFYVLACSAVDRDDMEWTRKIFWYYNVDNIFKRVSQDTRMEFAEKNGRISFELLLPWKDVYPYHPWISDGIGFNLCFVKAIGEQNKNFYKVLDAELGAENSKRDYVLLNFQNPVHKNEPQTYFTLDRNHIDTKSTLTGTSVTVASEKFEEDLVVYLKTGENDLLDYAREIFTGEPGINVRHFEINKNPIPSGGFSVQWESRKNSSRGETYLTALPPFEEQIYMRNVSDIKDNLSISSYHTLLHRVFEINQDLSEVKPYETCGEQRMAILCLKSEIEKAKNGVDVISEQTSFVRKGYQSEFDKTLQPYMVYLPEDYNPGHNYPLVIYLHGSASDETNIVGLRYLIPEGFIALSPLGRGPSNCYSWDNSQTDIAEAIDAVIQSYSIDEAKILLTGFSMGGYGVYRTFYETPGRFSALAIFSGHPNLANLWGNDNIYPNFSQSEYLKKFKQVPVFIFHGKQDRNCLFETTENIIELLKKEGALVTFVSEEDKGHEAPSEETISKYYKWVEITFSEF